MFSGKSFGLLLTAIWISSCSDITERNIINDKSPFYMETAPFDPGATDQIISSVRGIANANRMDFLLARESLPPGDFNVTAAGPDLNLRVMHTATFDHGTMVISAISRGKPTEADAKMAREFFCVVSGRCENKPGAPPQSDGR